MGRDLTLCPDVYAFETPRLVVDSEWFCAHTRLDVHRDYRLFAAFAACGPLPLPARVRFTWYGDAGVEDRTTDAHARPLTYITPARLTTARLPGGLDAWNSAVCQFLLALPAHTRIVLYWH